jgi:hypothetical protein
VGATWERDGGARLGRKTERAQSHSRVGLTILSSGVCSWGMDTKNDAPFDLDDAWRPRACNTIQEYLEDAYGRLDRTGCVHAFRGVTRRFHNLWPSIDRWKIDPRDPVKIETQLLKDFRLQAWNDLISQEQQRCLLAETRWSNPRNTGTMVVARHRMVPTRCVDWTDSPLHALFFACEKDPECEGEVWWFNRQEFDHCVGAQWPRLFGKPGHVEADIEEDFTAERDAQWITAFNYMWLPGDRLALQRAWITMAGRLGTCHAEEIHRLGVRQKGRLVIPARLKAEALAFLGQMRITRESLGLRHGDPADEIAAQIRKKFEGDFLPKT